MKQLKQRIRAIGLVALGIIVCLAPVASTVFAAIDPAKWESLTPEEQLFALQTLKNMEDNGGLSLSTNTVSGDWIRENTAVFEVINDSEVFLPAGILNNVSSTNGNGEAVTYTTSIVQTAFSGITLQDLGYVSNNDGSEVQQETINKITIETQGGPIELTSNTGMPCSFLGGRLTGCSGNLTSEKGVVYDADGNPGWYELIYDTFGLNEFQIVQVISTADGDVREVIERVNAHGEIEDFANKINGLGIADLTASEITYSNSSYTLGDTEAAWGSLLSQLPGAQELWANGWTNSMRYEMYKEALNQAGMTIYECGTTDGNAYRIKTAIGWSCIDAKGKENESIRYIDANGNLVLGTLSDILKWLSDDKNYAGIDLADLNSMGLTQEELDKEAECKKIIQAAQAQYSADAQHGDDDASKMQIAVNTAVKNNGGRYSVSENGTVKCVVDLAATECKVKLQDKVKEIQEHALSILSASSESDQRKKEADLKNQEMLAIINNNYMDSDGNCAKVTDLNGSVVSDTKTPSSPSTSGSVDVPESSSSSTASTEDVDTQTCFASAGPMGWVLCPAISALDGILNTMYNFIEEHFLQIAVEGAFTNGSETQKAWDVMRNIANVIFVILLLLIILSQVTGFGIDNYGIKRTLPKLIIAAILVNLSFVVCQLSIDVSNIVGVGLRNLLQNLAPSGYGSDPLSAAQVAAGSVVSGSLGLGLIAAAATSATVGLPGIVVAILLAVLSAVISMLFLFIILMAREAALIMLVIVSPIALVLYMLPNTEKLAKKWIDAMKALLLLYPICSLMIGGGAFAGQVLASVSAGSDNWLIGVTAMLVQVVPYFFIPSLMRSSLKGLGDLGNRINGLGQRFNARARGAADRGMRSSERYKDAMQHRAQVRSDRFKDRQALRQTNVRRRFTLARRAYTGDDENGQPQFEFDRLNNTQKRELLEHQGRVRDIGTLDARIKSGMGRITDSSLAAQAAQYEMADRAQEVKDREALIQSGNLTTSDGEKLDSNDIGQLQGALQRELEKSESTVDTAFVKALQNMLSQKGEDGRDAVEEAMLSAQRSGKGVSGKARQAFSENIMNNWGADYKNNRRSVFEFAKANQSTGGDGSTSMQHYINTTAKGKAGSLTAEQFATMDDKEFGRYLGELSQAQKDSLGAEALTNIKNIKGNRADAIAAAMTNHYVSAGAAREALKKQAIDVNVNIPHGGGGRRRRR